jgi:hypothetical protein
MEKQKKEEGGGAMPSHFNGPLPALPPSGAYFESIRHTSRSRCQICQYLGVSRVCPPSVYHDSCSVERFGNLRAMVNLVSD